jgi:hypothetical protein
MIYNKTETLQWKFNVYSGTGEIYLALKVTPRSELIIPCTQKYQTNDHSLPVLGKKQRKKEKPSTDVVGKTPPT